MPEPRDEEENLFLSKLGLGKRFVLGMKEETDEPHVNDQFWHLFDSDGSLVDAKKWDDAPFIHGREDRVHYPCVGMAFDTHNWVVLPCESTSSEDNKHPIVVICQKSK